MQSTISCSEARAVCLILRKYFQIRQNISVLSETYANEHGHAKHVANDLQNVFVLRCTARANNSVRDLQAKFLAVQPHGQELALDYGTRVIVIARKLFNLLVVRVKIVASSLHSRSDFGVLNTR